MSHELVLTDATDGERHIFAARRLVIAGFTGRDRDAVRTHIRELAKLGVPMPASTPTFYVLDPGLVSTGDQIRVAGAFTSGEVEPVVLRQRGRWLLTVGSDHTDRDLEANSIHHSKAACGKPIASHFIPVDDVDWDVVVIRSWADGVEYQVGTLAALLPLDEIERAAGREGIAPTEGDVVFLGTVPVAGRLRPAGTFQVALHAGGHRIQTEYRIELAHGDAGAKA